MIVVIFAIFVSLMLLAGIIAIGIVEITHCLERLIVALKVKGPRA